MPAAERQRESGGRSPRVLPRVAAYNRPDTARMCGLETALTWTGEPVNGWCGDAGTEG
jgi:hypothetical protein